jgi:hypothetical protein
MNKRIIEIDTEIRLLKEKHNAIKEELGTHLQEEDNIECSHWMGRRVIWKKHDIKEGKTQRVIYLLRDQRDMGATIIKLLEEKCIELEIDGGEPV